MTSVQRLVGEELQARVLEIVKYSCHIQGLWSLKKC